MQFRILLIAFISLCLILPAAHAEPTVVTPDVPKLSWTMENGVKVFHLKAEVVRQEILPASSMAPAKVITVWGYNGHMPGPTIEVNEGDRLKFIVTNNLPESTTVHWHGLEVPIAMDGVPFISQKPIEPGETFVYEFTVHQNGTYFYHSHGAMQEMMGMAGLFIIHPKNSYQPKVDHDFGLVLQEFAVLPNNPIPNSMSMEYNWLTINGKSAPATTPLIVKLGNRVRIRFVNQGMDHHPMHLHGHQFFLTGTEGGRAPRSSWYPENTIIVGASQSRDVEFVAQYPGDWMLHCHLPHHMMNNMVSSVGPMTHIEKGLHTGAGMEEGMGMVRQGDAGDESLGPSLGRGLGLAADRDRPLSNALKPSQSIATAGYPQDALMSMPMDKAVAKPETNYLAKGWSAALSGMMTLVRVLPADKYDQLMADIKAGRKLPRSTQMQMMPEMKMP